MWNAELGMRNFGSLRSEFIIMRVVRKCLCKTVASDALVAQKYVTLYQFKIRATVFSKLSDFSTRFACRGTRLTKLFHTALFAFRTASCAHCSAVKYKPVAEVVALLGRQ